MFLVTVCSFWHRLYSPSRVFSPLGSILLFTFWKSKGLKGWHRVVLRYHLALWAVEVLNPDMGWTQRSVCYLTPYEAVPVQLAQSILRDVFLQGSDFRHISWYLILAKLASIFSQAGHTQPSGLLLFSLHNRNLHLLLQICCKYIFLNLNYPVQLSHLWIFNNFSNTDKKAHVCSKFIV